MEVQIEFDGYILIPVLIGLLGLMILSIRVDTGLMFPGKALKISSHFELKFCYNLNCNQSKKLFYQLSFIFKSIYVDKLS